MSPERLTRVAIGTTIAVLAALFALLFFESDAEATRRCVEQGYSEEFCGWR
jgi:hypothetical protein